MVFDKYWVKPTFDSIETGPSWRSYSIPFIGASALFLAGWYYSKDQSWNIFKHNATLDSAQTIHQLPYPEQQQSQRNIRVVNKPSEQYPSPQSRKYLD